MTDATQPDNLDRTPLRMYVDQGTFADGTRLFPPRLEPIHIQPGHPGNPLTDEQVCDIAVASGWIEDTPEARAAYLAQDE